MARTAWFRTQLIAFTAAVSCALLVGCATLPGPSGTVPGDEATPQEPDSVETVDAVDFSDPASCLIGTWQEDLAALTRTAAGGTDMKWSGGAFLRFDHKGMFFVWAEDSKFESWFGDVHSSLITNGNGVGDYALEGEIIHWSDYSTLNLHVVTYEDGVFVEETKYGDLGDFSVPGAFTCTEDKLEVLAGDSRLSIPRYYDRIADKASDY